MIERIAVTFGADKIFGKTTAPHTEELVLSHCPSCKEETVAKYGKNTCPICNTEFYDAYFPEPPSNER